MALKFRVYLTRARAMSTPRLQWHSNSRYPVASSRANAIDDVVNTVRRDRGVYRGSWAQLDYYSKYR